MAYRDPAQGRARDRERFRKRTAERQARGLCPKCGERWPENGLSLCTPCTEKRRASDRARDARRRAEGKKRRRNPASERARDRRRVADLIAKGFCTKCGKEPAAPARRLCAGCGEQRRQDDRARYADARTRGEKYGARTRTSSARPPAPQVPSAGRPASMPGRAPGAAAGLPSRAARAADNAGTGGASPSASGIASAGQPGFA